VYAEPINMRPNRAVRPSPIFLGFVAAGVLGGWLAWSDTASSRTAQIGVFLLVLGGWVVSLCLHEFAHAYTAYRAGDHSVEAAGYLTLNPFKYAHPIFSIVLPLVFIAQGGIGLPGGAVYLHPHSFRTRAQRSLASAVGPLTNVAFALIVLQIAGHHDAAGPHGRFWGGLAFLGFLQVSAAILNLLPIPGLDGYGIIEPYLSPEFNRSMAPVKQFGMIGVYVLLQINQLNSRFFELIEHLYDAAGGQANAWAYGYELFRFWNSR
jgi:Zn-dependent protease